MDEIAAVNLLRRVSIFQLAGTDGCLCMSCAIQGISIDVSCRKSGSSMEKIDPDFYGIKVRVHSRSMDASRAALQAVADEVVKQLQPEGYDIMVRLCDDRIDADQLCNYCEKPRDDPHAYFCSRPECQEGRAKSWFDCAK